MRQMTLTQSGAPGCFYMDLSILYLLLVVTGVMHEVDDAYSIRSTWLFLHGFVNT